MIEPTLRQLLARAIAVLCGLENEEFDFEAAILAWLFFAWTRAPNEPGLLRDCEILAATAALEEFEFSSKHINSSRFKRLASIVNKTLIAPAGGVLALSNVRSASEVALELNNQKRIAEIEIVSYLYNNILRQSVSTIDYPTVRKAIRLRIKDRPHPSAETLEKQWKRLIDAAPINFLLSDSQYSPRALSLDLLSRADDAMSFITLIGLSNDSDFFIGLFGKYRFLSALPFIKSLKIDWIPVPTSIPALPINISQLDPRDLDFIRRKRR